MKPKPGQMTLGLFDDDQDVPEKDITRINPWLLLMPEEERLALPEGFHEANRNSATGFFTIVGILLVEGWLDIDRDIGGNGYHIDELREAYPTPETPAPSNGWNSVACNGCGIGDRYLQMNLTKGWLCPKSHREWMMECGYEDEYGNETEFYKSGGHAPRGASQGHAPMLGGMNSRGGAA